MRGNQVHVYIPKIGLILTPSKAPNWLNNVNKLTSTRQKHSNGTRYPAVTFIKTLAFFKALCDIENII